MKIDKRRRIEGKTNYLARKKLLQSEAPRIVFRKTNKYVTAQYVVSKEAQDSVKIGLSSKELLKYGWPKESIGGLKSTTAAYFLGLLIGKKIIHEKLKHPILDFGLIRAIHKNKLFAFIKGVKDSGIEVKCPEEAFPSEERIKGEHLKNKINFKEIKLKITGK